MPDVRLRPCRKGSSAHWYGLERARILAGLARIADDEPTLDVKAIVGSTGWRRLRIGTYRACYRLTTTTPPDGEPAAAYVVERIVHRRDFDAVATHLPAPDET